VTAGQKGVSTGISGETESERITRMEREINWNFKRGRNKGD
jgi:hypothetical protein